MISRAALATVLTALVVLPSIGCASGADDADTTEGSVDEVKTDAGPILAIGDSVTFGWDPFIETDIKKVDEKDHAGYAEVLGQRSKSQVHNTSCPGEGTGSFFDKTAPDNGCRVNRRAFGTHLAWKDGGRSFDTQMDFVEAYLKKNKPRFITLTLGGNDLGILQKECNDEMICIAAKLLGVINKVGTNLTEIFERIDAAGYKGQIAVFTQYSPKYGDLKNDVAIGGLGIKIRDFVKDEQRRHPNLGVVTVDAYEGFQKVAEAHGGDTCKTGLLIPTPDGKACDIHPTPKGDKLLADLVEAALERGRPTKK